MDLKLPPPVVLLITLGGMYLLSQYWPLWTFTFWGQFLLVLVFCLGGTLVGLAGVMSFAKERTTVDPRNPHKASSLVTSGIYRFSRNPMYLGLVLFLIAAFIYLSALSALVMIPLFIFYMNNFQIGPEEDVLEAIFGEEYRQYCEQVRRWC
ncbi:methyltransferase family protein [Photobacterium alginatilyticum]|uniref:Isoprenylcysteine carboxylmethyltransferase family protein n=1 Tax=Photobacterium alginatilyticum TaxID=1775171 RepID=A0ABW9YK04_9GAMM|nr:isoprenylcysteine carboxylmethyltransferase family protein [Photobacterium alginatilyticum]NBI54113.1 isoprenylcysteine carboxylmethyltransferase family protein [Photobacterium alginatilyticum]